MVILCSYQKKKQKAKAKKAAAAAAATSNVLSLIFMNFSVKSVNIWGLAS